jgi:hypothetical protein
MMLATMAMVETAMAMVTLMATVMAMTMAMFQLLPPTGMMLMTMMAAFKDGNRTMAIGQQ